MRITSRQLGGYIMARREWIGENDTYNKAHFGITFAQYNQILHAILDLTGNPGDIPSLARINSKLG